ncbi:hypothetical protein OAM79_04255 [Litorivicinus sp.]|nr:hypothetical protein [Litorivicinus sp.]
MVIVEFPNFSFLIFLLRERKSIDKLEVLFLFKNKSEVAQKIIEFVLETKNIKYSYSLMTAEKVFREQEVLCDFLVDDVFPDEFTRKSFVPDFIVFNLKNWFYCRLYRLSLIISFIKEEYPDHSEVLLYRHFFWFDRIDSRYLLRNFRFIGGFLDFANSPRDSEFQVEYRISRLKEIKNSAIFSLGFIIIRGLRILFSQIRFGSGKPQVQNLVLTHENNCERAWLSHKPFFEEFGDVNGFVTLDSHIILGEKKISIYKLLSWSFSEYFCTVIGAFQRAATCPRIPIELRLEHYSLMIEYGVWRAVLLSLKPKIFYSNVETNTATVIHSVAKDLGVTSVSSTLSFGYFPTRYQRNHQTKFAEINFCWGELHKEILAESGSDPKSLVCGGYPGSLGFYDILHKSAGPFDSEQVVLYDSNLGPDMYLQKEQLSAVIAELRLFCDRFDWILCLKGKASNTFYGNEKDSDASNPPKLDMMRGSPYPIKNGALHIGFASSTPALIAASVGMPTILIDPNHIIYPRLRRKLEPFVLNSLEDLTRTLDLVGKGHIDLERFCWSENLKAGINSAPTTGPFDLIRGLVNKTYSPDSLREILLS